MAFNECTLPVNGCTRRSSKGIRDADTGSAQGSSARRTARRSSSRIGARFLIATDETDQGFALIEHPMPPRSLAAPLHRHAREDEYSFVLEGRMGALLGEHTVLHAEPRRPGLQAA